MTAVRFSREAEADIVRLVDFLLQEQPAAAVETADLIVSAVDVLASHPLIGRPGEEGLRELVISRGRSGYLALYDNDAALDEVLVAGLRHQREAGYPR